MCASASSSSQSVLRHADLFFGRPPEGDEDMKVAEPQFASSSSSSSSSVPLDMALRLPPLALPRAISSTDIFKTPIDSVGPEDIDAALDPIDFPEFLEVFYICVAADFNKGSPTVNMRERLRAALLKIDEFYGPLRGDIQNYKNASLEERQKIVEEEENDTLREVLEDIAEMDEADLDRLLVMLGDTPQIREKRIYAKVPDRWPVFAGQLIPGTNRILQQSELGQGKTRIWILVTDADEINGIS